MSNDKYSDIRPLLPHEVPAAIGELLQNPMLKAIYEDLGMKPSWEELSTVLSGCSSVDAFKKRFSANVVRYLMSKTCHSVEPLVGAESLEDNGAYTFISNHRDIILDSAFLNVLLDDAGKIFPEIAIGNNLMVYPWVKTLVRLNGSFLVKRNLQGREVLLAAKKLSEYIHDTVASGRSIWIAQREGRAKDSSDRTQPALLKMLSIGGQKRSILDSLGSLNIVPVSCSYEYDPCDYLKAREMQLKRDMADYRKSKDEDAISMRTGVMDYKGRVSFAAGRSLNELITSASLNDTSEADMPDLIAKLIDNEIHRNYRLYPCNYIAWDRLHANRNNEQLYTPEEEAAFEKYLSERLNLIELPNGITKDNSFLTERLLEMYANPAINHYRARRQK